MLHFSVLGMLKYSIGWRPQKDPIEKRSDWEKIRLRKDPIEKRSDWEKIRLRKDPIEKRSDWEKIRLRKDSIEKRSNWEKIQLRIASIETSLDWEKTRMGNAEIEWHEDWNQTEHIMMKVILVKMGKSRWSKQWINYKKRGSRGSEQLIIDEWAVCREIWSIVPLKKDIYSMAHL